MNYSDEMARTSDIVIKYVEESRHSRWHVVYNSVLQDASETALSALKIAAKFILGRAPDQTGEEEINVRWVNTPDDFVPPNIEVLLSILNDDEEPIQ